VSGHISIHVGPAPHVDVVPLLTDLHVQAMARAEADVLWRLDWTDATWLTAFTQVEHIDSKWPRTVVLGWAVACDVGRVVLCCGDFVMPNARRMGVYTALSKRRLGLFPPGRTFEAYASDGSRSTFERTGFDWMKSGRDGGQPWHRMVRPPSA
jgi:hypothetical protein